MDIIPHISYVILPQVNVVLIFRAPFLIPTLGVGFILPHTNAFVNTFFENISKKLRELNSQIIFGSDINLLVDISK